MTDDRDMVNIAYVEDNVLWLLVGWLLMVALLAIIAVLGACYLVGAWLAGKVERQLEGRRRREVQSRPVLR